MVVVPSPLQFSHRPPATLNEKSYGSHPFVFESLRLENKSRMPSKALT